MRTNHRRRGAAQGTAEADSTPAEVPLPEPPESATVSRFPAPARAGVRGRQEEEDLRRWVATYLRHAPVSLCVRELNRLFAMSRLLDASGPKGPILDVGCGDGFWWTQLEVEGRQVFGVDISSREVARAARHIVAEVADISTERPFPSQAFSLIVGNCSLEHVRDIDAALSNIVRAGRRGAQVILFVPARDWAYQGYLQRFLLRRTPRIAMALSGAMNGFFQHWHLYDASVWQRLLEANGLRVTGSFGLGSARSELLFRLFLPEGFLEFVARSLFGHYPSKLLRFLPAATLRPLERLLEWGLSEPLVALDAQTAYEYVFVAELR